MDRSSHTSGRYASTGARGRAMKPELGGGREGNGESEKIQASETVPKPDNITPLEIIYGRSV